MRRLAALAVAFGLCGCNPGRLEGGPFSCVFDGGIHDEGQCPGDWRCGVENYCHHYNDTSVAWRCYTSDQCELGWSCGLDDNRDAGQCHDPDKPSEWACLDDSHCTGKWHCGPALRCYDRTVPAPHACRADAGDCANGWRCGLTGLCQNTAAPGPFPCGSDGGIDDSWCEQGWRCSPAGTCIDPAEDALSTSPLAPLDGGVRINPLLSNAPITRLSISPLYDTGPGRGLQTAAYVQNATVQAILSDRLGGGFAAHYELGRARDVVALAAMGSRGAHLSSNQQFDVADDVARVYLAYSDGGVVAAELYLDGGLSGPDFTWIDTMAPVTRMSLGSAAGTQSPRVVGFSSDPDLYVRLIGSDDWITSAFLQEYDVTGEGFADDGGNRIVDVASVRSADVTECVFAADTRGLWVRQHDLSAGGNGHYFVAVQVPPFANDYCTEIVGNAPTQRITGLASNGRDWLGVSSTNLDGGGNFVSVIDLRLLWANPDPDSVCFSVDDCFDPLPVEVNFGPCSACPQRLLDFAVVVDEQNRPKIEARCGSEDGGTTGFFSYSLRPGSTSCVATLEDAESGPFGRRDIVKADQVTPGQVAWGSDDGLLWAGRSALGAASMLFDRAPTAVAQLGPLAADVRLFDPTITGTPLEGLGFATSLASGVLSGVDREPAWVITEDRQVIDVTGTKVVSVGRLIGLVGNSVTAFGGPLSAVSAKSAAAGRVLVVAAGSSIFSGEMDPVFTGQQGYAQVALRVVSPGQLNSIAFQAQTPAGAYLKGYAVTPSGVLRVTAETATRWSFAEVPLPNDRVPVEVWFENNRGRVGFGDGSVYALPSRVPIAQPEPALSAIDYAQGCGQQFLLATRGVYRLQPRPGNPIGEWKSVELPTDFATGGFVKGRLHGVGNALFVFTASGEGARIDLGDSCPSP